MRVAPTQDAMRDALCKVRNDSGLSYRRWAALCSPRLDPSTICRMVNGGMTISVEHLNTLVTAAGFGAIELRVA